MNASGEFTEPTVCFSADIDWASDYVIKATMDYFQGKGIPLMLFWTHESELIERAKANPLFGCGYHPNFLFDSSQAPDRQERGTQSEHYNAVFETGKNILGDATFFRSHRYYQSNDINDMAVQKGYKYSSNTCTRQELIPPFRHRSGLYEFPVFFEDGSYLWNNGSLDFGEERKGWFSAKEGGLYIINIHPMHMAVNTPYFQYTRDIKDRLSREEFNNIGAREVEILRFKGYGIADFVKEMAEFVLERKIRTGRLDLVAERTVTKG
jgi:hypothetical protein